MSASEPLSRQVIPPPCANSEVSNISNPFCGSRFPVAIAWSMRHFGSKATFGHANRNSFDAHTVSRRDIPEW
jgi:hypothetical protein